VVFSSEDPQQEVEINLQSTAIGAPYDAGDDGDWRLFQLGARVTSTEGIGRHTYFAVPGHAGNEIEVLPRFPDNPIWERGQSSFLNYSEVSSGVILDIEVHCFNMGDDDPRPNQAVVNELLGVGDGERTVFYTDWRYTPLSLEVFVDGVSVGVDETDPEERKLTLSFAPEDGEEVRASYQFLGT
jgi:hypothetical protein